jgi:hypothetical protein
MIKEVMTEATKLRINNPDLDEEDAMAQVIARGDLDYNSTMGYMLDPLISGWDKVGYSLTKGLEQAPQWLAIWVLTAGMGSLAKGAGLASKTVPKLAGIEAGAGAVAAGTAGALRVEEAGAAAFARAEALAKASKITNPKKIADMANAARLAATTEMSEKIMAEAAIEAAKNAAIAEARAAGLSEMEIAARGAEAARRATATISGSKVANLLRGSLLDSTAPLSERFFSGARIAGSSGLLGGVMDSNEARRNYESVPFEARVKSPMFQEFLRSGFTPEEADRALYNNYADYMFIRGGLLNATIGSFGELLLFGKLYKSFGKGFWRNLWGGVKAAMGTQITETGTETWEGYYFATWEKEYGIDTQPWRSFLSRVMEEGTAGAVAIGPFALIGGGAHVTRNLSAENAVRMRAGKFQTNAFELVAKLNQIPLDRLKNNPELTAEQIKSIKRKF